MNWIVLVPYTLLFLLCIGFAVNSFIRGRPAKRRQEIAKEDNEIRERIREKYKSVKTARREAVTQDAPTPVYYDVDSYSPSTDSYDNGSDSDCGGDSGGGDGGSCD